MIQLKILLLVSLIQIIESGPRISRLPGFDNDCPTVSCPKCPEVNYTAIISEVKATYCPITTNSGNTCKFRYIMLLFSLLLTMNI